jgi:hypothetical protein
MTAYAWAAAACFALALVCAGLEARVTAQAVAARCPSVTEQFLHEWAHPVPAGCALETSSPDVAQPAASSSTRAQEFRL